MSTCLFLGEVAIMNWEIRVLYISEIEIESMVEGRVQGGPWRRARARWGVEDGFAGMSFVLPVPCVFLLILLLLCWRPLSLGEI